MTADARPRSTMSSAISPSGRGASGAACLTSTSAQTSTSGAQPFDQPLHFLGAALDDALIRHHRTRIDVRADKSCARQRRDRDRAQDVVSEHVDADRQASRFAHGGNRERHRGDDVRLNPIFRERHVAEIFDDQCIEAALGKCRRVGTGTFEDRWQTHSRTHYVPNRAAPGGGSCQPGRVPHTSATRPRRGNARDDCAGGEDQHQDGEHREPATRAYGLIFFRDIALPEQRDREQRRAPTDAKPEKSTARPREIPTPTLLPGPGQPDRTLRR